MIVEIFGGEFKYITDTNKNNYPTQKILLKMYLSYLPSIA